MLSSSLSILKAECRYYCVSQTTTTAHTHTYDRDRRAFRFPMLLVFVVRSLLFRFCLRRADPDGVVASLASLHWPRWLSVLFIVSNLHFSNFLPLFYDQCIFVPLPSLPCLIPGVSNKMYFQDSFMFCDFLIIN